MAWEFPNGGFLVLESGDFRKSTSLSLLELHVGFLKGAFTSLLLLRRNYSVWMCCCRCFCLSSSSWPCLPLQIPIFEEGLKSITRLLWRISRHFIIPLSQCTRAQRPKLVNSFFKVRSIF